MFRRCLLLLLTLLALVFATSCGSAAPAPTTAPTQAPVATTAPVVTKQGAVATIAPTQATAPTVAPTVAATQPAKATAAPTAASNAASKPAAFGKAELDKIFPPGQGQDLVFRACVNCHNWVPLVMADLSKGAWEQNKMNHRNRVSGLSDQEFDLLYNYLVQTFPAGHPVPTNIPEDLLSQWTSY